MVSLLYCPWPLSQLSNHLHERPLYVLSRLRRRLEKLTAKLFRLCDPLVKSDLTLITLFVHFVPD